MKVSLVSNTPDAEALVAYCARVSSDHQDDEDYERLLKYCIKHQHWSVFEMADMTVEIETSRAIATQILRHRSFHFQEFSQRYAQANLGFETVEGRFQDKTNRQNSLELGFLDIVEGRDAMSVKKWFEESQLQIEETAKKLYDTAVDAGIAKECARFLLPLSVTSRLYMKGTIRDWIHYINLRTGNGTQKEHKQVAEAIKQIFVEAFPQTSHALGWH